ncbi:MAG: DUF4124 domain-containing protein [Gammaproteobacteria bacterium]|nr:DUF4124 domain-containing protein [Gammaproteobacteria bacterium]MCK5262505.1 DUF4124 domain-containing protein [Gammaproteobacteria bacterium]
MKSTIISMFIVLILMIAVPMFLLSDADFAQKFGFGGGSGDANAPKNIKKVVTDERVEVYKWVDEYGVMQFSNKPPLDDRDSEKIVLTPDINVIDAIEIPEEVQEEAAKPGVFSLGSPYSPDGMKKMVDDSKEVKEQLNQRQAEQEKVLQDLFKR